MMVILNLCFKKFGFGLDAGSVVLVDFLHILRSVKRVNRPHGLVDYHLPLVIYFKVILSQHHGFKFSSRVTALQIQS